VIPLQEKPDYSPWQTCRIPPDGQGAVPPARSANKHYLSHRWHGGNVSLVPTNAAAVGPKETWKAEKVSIWHPGHHDNPFGIRLSALMIAKRIVDTAVLMSLLANHPNVQFSYLPSGIGSVAVEMH